MHENLTIFIIIILSSQGFQTIPPESLIIENAKEALKHFLEHGDFGRTKIGPKDEVRIISVIIILP